MALETTKTTYLNGSSKDGNRVLANFSSSLSESGTMTINETISESTNLDTVEADFNEFRELAKNELKKLNTQDTETDVSSDKPVDKEAAATTSDNKPAGAITKADDKPETDVSNDKSGDKEVATTTSDSEAAKDDKPAETSVKPDDKEVATTTSDSEKVKDDKPVSTSAKPETDTSDAKDGETVDESN